MLLPMPFINEWQCFSVSQCNSEPFLLTVLVALQKGQFLGSVRSDTSEGPLQTCFGMASALLCTKIKQNCPGHPAEAVPPCPQLSGGAALNTPCALGCLPLSSNHTSEKQQGKAYRNWASLVQCIPVRERKETSVQGATCGCVQLSGGGVGRDSVLTVPVGFDPQT